MDLIAIRMEDKNRWERRAPIVPEHVEELRKDYSIETLVQASPIRAYTEEEYEEAGATIVDGPPKSPVIFGVKEIPPRVFREGKTYAFFAHVIKGQDYNMPMVRKMMDLKCNLIDYEKIADDKGRRLVFFGKEAGQAGMIDTLWTLGVRLRHEGIQTPFSDVLQTIAYGNLSNTKSQLRKVGERIKKEGLPREICPLIVGFSGYGNVSKGAQEVFDSLPNEEITPEQALTLKESGDYSNRKLYKVVFKEEHIVEPKTGKFNLQDYYNHPENYKGVFDKYVPHLTVLVNCIYWEERYPRLVTKALIKEIYSREDSPTFRVVGDVSCDIEGSIEATMHTTNPDHPAFVYDPENDKVIHKTTGRGLAIMAVENLPAELPREASARFSKSLEPFVVPIARADYTVPFEKLDLPSEVKKAVILYHGELTPDYEYIKKFL